MIIERDPAEKSGGSIVESILTTRQSKIERGRNEIEVTALDKNIKTASLLRNKYYPTGLLYEVYEDNKKVIGLHTEFSLDVSINNTSINIKPQMVLEIPK